MKLTVGQKIMGGFLIVIAIITILSGYTYVKIGAINDEYQAVLDSNVEKILLAEGLRTDVAEEAGTVRRFNLTGDPAARAKFNNIRMSSDEKISKMEKIFLTENAQKLIKTLKQEKAAYEVFSEKAMQAKQAGNQKELLLCIQQGAQPYANAQEGANQLVEMIKTFVEGEQTKIREDVSSIQQIMLILNILAILVAIAISFVVSRGISSVAQQLVAAASEIADGKITKTDLQTKSSDEMGQIAAAFNKMKNNLRELLQAVSQSAEQVSASSQQLTASANQSAQAANQVTESITGIAQGAENQMNAVEETSAVVQQMSASVQQVAANANKVAEVSGQAAESARTGGLAVTNAINQMLQIEQTVSTSASLVETLGERSKEIGQIVDTISGIAGQTNLLALNAAIEAARAGEQGRGFAVVAEEVRKLAEQSQEAAKQIAKLIGEIQGDTDKAVAAMGDGTREVKHGSEVVNAAGAAFQEIADEITLVSGQVREISAAMQQMASGSQQIVASTKDIDNLSRQAASEAQTVSAATQEQSASVEEIAASSQALAKMAEELQTAVSRFSVS